ncbi:hypothetical protein [Nocardiopsis potens]|uniref:hypothetical protein n=1 Tax=Nocardiopsis potens TaxID=1246458 RepID=UPI000348F41B|nr:hypothetical protein [Nocardiopsis potens]
MGYTTVFSGQVAVTPPLNEHEIAYLTKFSRTRRVDRENGPYYVEDASGGGTRDASGYATRGASSRVTERAADVRDADRPPEGQPELWCQWVPTEDGAAIVWDEVEKFYGAEEWMRYLIDHFLKPGARAQADPGPVPPAEFARFTFDHSVSGVIEAEGEDFEDRWRLVVEDNRVTRVEEEPGDPWGPPAAE